MTWLADSFNPTGEISLLCYVLSVPREDVCRASTKNPAVEDMSIDPVGPFVSNDQVIRVNVCIESCKSHLYQVSSNIVYLNKNLINFIINTRIHIIKKTFIETEKTHINYR